MKVIFVNTFLSSLIKAWMLLKVIAHRLQSIHVCQLYDVPLGSCHSVNNGTQKMVTVQLDWLVMNGNVFGQIPVGGDVRKSGGVRRKTPPRVFNTPPRSWLARPSPSRVTPPRTSPPRASPLRQLHSRLTRKMVRIAHLSFTLIMFLV